MGVGQARKAMADARTPQAAIVVILTRDATFGAGGMMSSPGRDVSVLRVESPYEAMAELLRQPPDVLVIDLRIVSERHEPLIRLARKLGVKMLAAGALVGGIDGDVLAGVELVARGDLSGRVTEEILTDRAGSPHGPTNSPQPEHPKPDRASGEADPNESPASQYAPVSPSQADAPDPDGGGEGKFPVTSVSGRSARDTMHQDPAELLQEIQRLGDETLRDGAFLTEGDQRSRHQDTTRGLLTEEELSALLENES
jgi:hypothetical protein